MNRATARVAASLIALVALGALLSVGKNGLTGKAAGDPGDNPDATFTLITPDGGASVAYRGGEPTTCHDMARYDLAQPAYQLDFEGPGVGTAVLRLYEGPGCEGKSRDFEAAADALVEIDLTQEAIITAAGMHEIRYGDGMLPRSYRVVVTEPQVIPNVGGGQGCAARGETLIDNGFMTVGLGDDGRLGLFRRDDESGALEPVGEGVDSTPYGVTGWDTACIDFGGLRATAQLSQFDLRAWAFQPDDQTEMVLTADCRLITRSIPGGYGSPRVLFDGHCFDDMRVEMPETDPSLELLFTDIDGDESPEMILDVRAPDSSGYFMTDPMGIASVLYAAGADIGPDFYMALSKTQKDGVRQQTLAVTWAGGAAGINALLNAVSANPEEVMGNFIAFPYTYSFEYDGADFDADGRVGDANASFHFNRRKYHLKTDQNGVSAAMEMTLAEVSISDLGGYATLNVKAGTQMAEFTVVNDGFVVGASADAIAVSFTGGREDRSHIAISASYGQGALVAASWGRRGLYGFTLQVPGVPVGVAIYVHRDEAIAVHDQAVVYGQQWARWNREAARDTSAFYSRVISETSRDVAAANNDMRVAMRNAESEAGVFMRRVGTQVTLAVSTASGQVQTTIEGGFEQVRTILEATANNIGDAIIDAAGDAAQFAASIGTTIDTAVNDTVNAVNQAANDVQNVANAVVNFFGQLF